MPNKNLILVFLVIGLFLSVGCKKLIEVSRPAGTITTAQVFSEDAQAVSALYGIYYNMINTTANLSNYGMSVYAGMSADELIPFDQNYNDNYIQFRQNNLISTNGQISSCFWIKPFTAIYAANAILEGLQNYSGVHDSVKNELIGEAEFVRAFSNFYLINLFGDIPLVTTINWQKTNLLGRTSTTQIYQDILADLLDAQSRMVDDYSVGGGQRIIPNKWAATAMLARVYLYLNDYQDAQIQSSNLINNGGLFSLVNNLDSVFLTNSTEAIWQLQQNNTTNTYNATPEGALLIPRALNSIYQPFAYLTKQLLSSFEPGDQRRIKWVDSTKYTNVIYYFPYKYKIGKGQAAINGPYTEYYMVLRLAEQYLIRAEAEANLDDLPDAITDINAIRIRASLPPLDSSLSQSEVIDAIMQERRIEFFAEWGNRWLDLKRTGEAVTTLSTNKGFQVSEQQLLYPIPQTELITDPNLTQNAGY